MAKRITGCKEEMFHPEHSVTSVRGVNFEKRLL